MSKVTQIREKITNFRNHTDIDEKNYDGSYVLSQEISKQYAEQYPDIENDLSQQRAIHSDDINLIYYAATISNQESLLNYAENANLDVVRITTIKDCIKSVFEKIASDHPYDNNLSGLGKKDRSGMIGRNMNITIGFNSGSEEFYWSLVALVTHIHKYKVSCKTSGVEQSPSVLLDTINPQLFAACSKINQVGANTISAVLHCNCPDTFPLLNGQSSRIIFDLLKSENVSGIKKFESNIVENYKAICSSMVSNFPCKNYRDLDVCIDENTSSKIEKEVFALFKMGYRQIVLTGAPGTGKTYSAQKIANEDDDAVTISTEIDDNGSNINIKYQFVQFHPSFDYTDFVEGLRPVQLKEDQNPTFVRIDGIFKSFCRKAAEEENKDARYYFIIDEINRADLSKVFGELMYCLEYRGPKARIKTQYSNLTSFYISEGGPKPFEKGNDVFEEGFYIPENVYIIGTMNDIDRSVESFDFALRRRFKWLEIKANDVMRPVLQALFEDDENKTSFILNKVNALNSYISNYENGMGLSEAHHIGPAYFKGYKDLEKGQFFRTKISDIYRNEIETTLKEYVRGRDQNSIDRFLEGCRKSFGLDKNYSWLKEEKETT